MDWIIDRGVTSDLLGYHVFYLQQPLWPKWREMYWQTIWLHTLGQRMIKKRGSGRNLNQPKHSPTTVGSRSTYIALGTWRPELPVLKNVLNGSSREFSSAVVSRETPSGPIPCSRQNSSQQAFPVCTPAWPTWIEMHSLWTERI